MFILIKMHSEIFIIGWSVPTDYVGTLLNYTQ